MARLPEDWTQVNLQIPKRLHRHLRILAAANERSVNAEIRRLVVAAVKKELGVDESSR